MSHTKICFCTPICGAARPDAGVARVEDVEHVVDEPGDLAVDLRHGSSLRLQHRITEDADGVAHGSGYRRLRAPCQARPVGHYYDDDPAVASDRREVEWSLPDGSLRLLTDAGGFGHGRVDTGTKLLLLKAPPPPQTGNLLDLGCGTGAIAVGDGAAGTRHDGVGGRRQRARTGAAARRTPNATRIGNVVVAAPDDVSGRRASSRRSGAIRRSASASRPSTSCS
jgi:hypothetical protein